MLVAARAHYFHCQKVLPLLYFEFAMDGISSRWKVQQQVKDLLKPGGKSSGKGKQEKMQMPTTSEDEDGSDANYDKTLEEAQCEECSFI